MAVQHACAVFTAEPMSLHGQLSWPAYQPLHSSACSASTPCPQSMLEKAGVKVMLNELSSTVVFERPREEAFVRKWQVRSRGT